jgi:hypothetical protein
MKVWWKSKTIWVNTLIFALSVIVMLQDAGINWEYMAIITTVVNIVLRFVTTNPVGFFDEDVQDE